jgi:outer membrane protein assembly factor BamB
MLETKPAPETPKTSPLWERMILRLRRMAFVRLAIAWVMTLGVLVYFWGRTLVIWMMIGRPEAPFLAGLVVSLAAVMLLTYRLSAELNRPRLDRFVIWGVPLSWVGTIALVVFLNTGTLMPRLYVLLIFVPATLWVVWAAWMFYRPVPWLIRSGVLVLLGSGVSVSLNFLRVDGLTGDRKLNFAWRWEKPAQEWEGVPEDKQPASPENRPNLTRTTDHDYAQFLGPQRLAVLPDAHLARDWKAHPPREVWRKAVGTGWSAFAVVGDYAITQEQRGPDECVVCYRIPDGAEVWVHTDAARFDKTLGGPGPRATPTIAGGRVYSVGATGILNCLDGATGQAVWSLNIQGDPENDNISHGVCASPLVLGEKVIVCPTGANRISLAAYNRDTGDRVWQAGKYQASYGSPLVTELAGTTQILLYTSEGVSAHDPVDGRILWDFSWTNSERVNCSQPVPHAGAPDQVFLSTDYNQGCTLLAVERLSDGSWACRQKWRSNRMQTRFTTCVVHGGYAYGLDGGFLACLDLATGKKYRKFGRYEYGQVLRVGELLLIQAEKGDVVLVEPSPQECRELGRIHALSSKTWNNPALAGKYLLVRNDHEAVCYELPLEPGS